MTTHRNNFAGQTVDTDVTEANSADSGDAFTTVYAGSGTIQYVADPASGGRIAVALTPAGGTPCFVRDASFNSTEISISDCFYYSGAPSGETILQQVSTAAGWAADVLLEPSGKLKIYAHSGSGSTASAALIAGHWYRIEAQIVSDDSAGSIACQWYIDDGTTQTGELSVTATETRGGAITTITRGFPNTGTAPLDVWYYTNLQVQDGTTDALGPYASSSAIPISVTSNDGGWTANTGTIVDAVADGEVTSTYISDSEGAIVLRLAAMSDAPGTVTVTADAGSDTQTLKVELLQGSTVIASSTFDVTESPDDYTLATTSTERGNVTDATSLDVRLTAG